MSFTSIQIKGHIVNGIRRSALSILLLGILQLLSEGIIIGLLTDLVDDDLLQVFRDFVDDVFGAILAQLQVVEGLDTIGVDGKSSTSQKGRGSGDDMEMGLASWRPERR